MFTGLIEEQGKIRAINSSSNGIRLTIECDKILSDIRNGASICTNGVCLTVTDFGKDFINLDVSNETVRVSTFKDLKINDYVNLERALTLSKRIDGHIVSGHIDCIATLTNKKNDGFSKEFFFKVPKEFSKYIIYKGSIAINGVSLTIASIKDEVFSVELIPTTLNEVNLSRLSVGDKVNIETDLFAKYVEKILGSKDNNSKINYSFLAENGFV